MPLAHKIGSLLFCPSCGTLLDLPKDGEDTVVCEQCKHIEPASSYENLEIITHSQEDAFPSVLSQSRKTQTKKLRDDEGLQRVAERCPHCGQEEAYLKQLQLRGADEGSTNLYTCISCGKGWTLQN